ncbi:LPS export ABC transporter protein LptC [Fontimonas thermophila]|uniref:LPS export ABC transporter protein LptC n=1 Tax=Fontimonas thermophila TaxID=1076937 RepID=A0A1I2K4I6_9GAMM|nr:LPS export ABC transporter periplasmic protein LptC [Fontimonas thermophila]SFF61333.1 LPS export ABC transporter protein LptC [Fontimonas thermophila]
MARPRITLTLPALGLLGLIAGWIVFEDLGAPVPEPMTDAVERPRYRLEGAHWRRYDAHGAPVLEATVESIDYFDDTSMELTGIELMTRGNTGGWQLRAPLGSVPASASRMLLHPQVEITGAPAKQPALRIQTDSLWADWQARTLSTTDPVSATAPDRTIEAVGLQADWDARRLRFLHAIKAHHAPHR